jgi:hypothetical protein
LTDEKGWIGNKSQREKLRDSKAKGIVVGEDALTMFVFWKCIEFTLMWEQLLAAVVVARLTA